MWVGVVRRNVDTYMAEPIKTTGTLTISKARHRWFANYQYVDADDVQVCQLNGHINRHVDLYGQVFRKTHR